MCTYNCPFKFAMIKAEHLVSAQKYQRELKLSHVREIRDSFDPYLAHPILCSKRDGKYYVYDGQHTLTAMIQKYGKYVTIPILYVEGLTEAQEAKLFRHQSDLTSKISVGDALNAGLIGREEDVVEYCKVILNCGYGYDFARSRSSVDAVVTSHNYLFNQVYRNQKKGTKQVETILTIITTCWNKRGDALKEEVIKGIDLFTYTYRDGSYNYGRLISVLSDITPGAIKKEATGSNAKGNLRYADAILGFYNKGLTTRNKLPNRLK